MKPAKGILSLFAFIVTALGALISVYFTWRAGSKNTSVVLVCMFNIWVLLPYFILLLAKLGRIIRFKKDPVLLDSICLLLPVFSVLLYSRVLPLPALKPAFVFMAVPLLSLLVIITSQAFGLAGKKS